MSQSIEAKPDEQQVMDHCAMCLKSFGIVDDCIPRKCINPKCCQRFCTQCVRQIQTYNGATRPFQCAYCLHQYSPKEEPIEDECLKKKLWADTVVKCGIERTRYLLQRECDRDDLLFDVQCRGRHLKNLLSTLKRLNAASAASATIVEAENMTNLLLQLAQHLENHSDGNTSLYIETYRSVITLSECDEDIGLAYIRLCERLLLEISSAEFDSTFPTTSRLMNQWLREQGAADSFQPKVLELLKVSEHDLTDHRKSPHALPRSQIGVIGYTSAGKSTVLNRLLGVHSLDADDAAPVRSIKSTYYQLQFDRPEPLVPTHDRNVRIPVTFIDIQGLDKDRPTVNDLVEAGNYLDEIRKADCDIYLLVFDDELRYEQHGWMSYIEQKLNRRCVLVRSKVDIDYLRRFRELVRTPYGRSTEEQRNKYARIILEHIRHENEIKSRGVFLTAAVYEPESIDAEMLLNTNSFDFDQLLNELSDLVYNVSTQRIHLQASRAVGRIINTCFRRGYVLNIMKYKIAAGVAAIIPFGDQLPRYLSRNSIREAFGINDELHQYLSSFNLTIEDDKQLQTSAFKKSVTIKPKVDPAVSARTIGTVAGYTAAAVGTLADDVVRVAVPTMTAASRAVFTVATIGIGVVLSAGVCAWSAVSSGQHIFSYVNRVCDDLILIIGAFITASDKSTTDDTTFSSVPK